MYRIIKPKKFQLYVTSKSNKKYAYYVEPTKNVSIGATGESVKWVQYELNEKLDIEVDGVFGANTKEAVKLFQKMNGLGADGIVGPATRKALGGN